ncbi:MAG TPA: hypothetical protein VK797_05575 [Tepidisphaeraceae bacterium]|nr:hypothetical protein [Tepidisphaeraceae bacterium]
MKHVTWFSPDDAQFSARATGLASECSDAKNVARPMNSDGLPLHYLTPPVWAQQVLQRPLELLNDHAHLERKAAAMRSSW